MCNVPGSWLGLAAGLILACSAAAQERLPLQAVPLESLEAFDLSGDNWQIAGHVSSDRGVRHDLQITPGSGVLVNLPASGARENLFTTWAHGDLELEVEFMMPQGSNSGIYLQGRYEVQLLDSWEKKHVSFGDAGGIYQRWDKENKQGYEGRPPRLNASRAPGLWQSLKIIFKAPVFDDSGRKLRHARFARVELNGKTIQENVTVTGPTRAAAYEDEAALGPLMIQGDHGPIAFRNIRYKIYGPNSVSLSDLRWRAYDEHVQAWPSDRSSLSAPRTGEALSLAHHDIITRQPVLVDWVGQITVPANGTYRFGVTLDWITGDPHFMDQRIGGALLLIDNIQVLEHSQNLPTTHADLHLEAGTYAFSFSFFKSIGGRPPGIGFTVEGADTPVHWLRPLPRVQSAAPIPVTVGSLPVVLRGFVMHNGIKLTHTVSVGNPQGIHYSLDLSTGALLHAWRGPFVNAAPMWHNRGHDQLAEPLGSLLTFSGLPAIASGADSLQFAGYRLDADGYPVFVYRLGSVQIEDAIRPEAPFLVRTLAFRGAAATPIHVVAATGTSIQNLGDGRFGVDDLTWYVEDAADAQIKSGDMGESLVIPVALPDGKAQITYAIVW